MSYTWVTPAEVPSAAEQHAVPMRDGVVLGASVYLRDLAGEPGPTVLIRLPYDKDGEYTFLSLVADYFNSAGYHVVAQDVRGKFRSEGDTHAFVGEVADGYDSIEWVATQPWSNGIVGMWGDSYYGFTQWAAVASEHPALRAIAPRVTGTRLGDRPDIAPGDKQAEVEYAHSLVYTVTHFYTRDTLEWDPDFTALPLIDEFERLQTEIGFRSASFDDAYPTYRPTKTARFERHPLDSRPVPTLHTIGWWDNCAPWSWDDQRQLMDHSAWRDATYLLLEPVDHENYILGGAFEGRERTIEETRAMLPHYLDPAIAFFDVFLRGEGSPDAIPRVRWNLAGTAGYRQSEVWPPQGSRPISRHLNPGGTLDAVPSTEDAIVAWTHDPRALVPSPTANAFAFLRYSPDERQIADRPDVIVFTSAPETTAINLIGKVRLSVHVEADAAEADLFARLYDRSPDGRLTRIALGQSHIFRADRMEEVIIDLQEIGYRLEPGHALQLHLQGSEYPEFMFSEGNGESPWSVSEPAAFELRVRLGSSAELTLAELPDPGPARTIDGRLIDDQSVH